MPPRRPCRFRERLADSETVFIRHGKKETPRTERPWKRAFERLTMNNLPVELRVDANFPGGNIVVDGVQGDTVIRGQDSADVSEIG